MSADLSRGASGRCESVSARSRVEAGITCTTVEIFKTRYANALSPDVLSMRAADVGLEAACSRAQQTSVLRATRPSV